MTLTDQSGAIYRSEKYGPTFGDDIKIVDKCNTIKTKSYIPCCYDLEGIY